MDGSGAPGAAPRRTYAAEIDDLDRLASVQREANVQHVRTGTGPFSMRLVGADFGALRMQSAAVTNSYLVRGTLRGPFHALLMRTEPTASARLNGVEVGGQDGLALCAGSEVQAHVDAGNRWMGLMLHPAEFGEVLAPLALERSGRVVGRGMLQAAPGLRPFLAALATQVTEAPDMLEGSAVAGAVVDQARCLLEAGIAGAVLEREGPADRRRMRLFRDAIDFLDSVLDRPVYSAAVGRAVGADPRAVNGAFRAVYGMTLHRYLLVRRLTLARQRLAGGADASRVKTVALDLGFWHLGRFSGAYRDLFGETPSETLARGRGNGPARADTA